MMAPHALFKNNNIVIRTFKTARKVVSNIITFRGNQHFSATAEKNQKEYPKIDVIKDLRRLF